MNTTSWWGIKELGISFGSIFFYLPMEVARGHIHGSQGLISGPRLLMTEHLFLSENNETMEQSLSINLH